MKMYPRRRTAIALALTAAGALGLAAGCLNAPAGDNASGPPQPLATGCDPVALIDKGALFRVSVSGGAVTKLLDQLNMPWEVIVDNNTLFFTEDGSGGCSSSIKMLPANAGPNDQPTVLISGVDHPRRPVISNGHLYFVEYSGSGSIIRVNLGTKESKVLISNLKKPFGLAVDGPPEYTWIYYTETGQGTDGTLKKVSVDSAGEIINMPVTLSTGLRMPIGLTMDSNYVYVAEKDGHRVFRVYKYSTNYDPNEEDLITDLTTPYPPVVEGPNDGTNTLYFTDFVQNDPCTYIKSPNTPPCTGKIYKLTAVDGNAQSGSGIDPIPTTASECMAGNASPYCTLIASTLSWPMLIVIDNNNIYWSEVYSSAVKRAAKDGSIPVLELASQGKGGIKKPLGIATDGQNVYFTDIGDNPCCF